MKNSSKKHKIFATMICTVASFAVGFVCYANPRITTVINEDIVYFKNPPIFSENRLLLPVVDIAEEFGCIMNFSNGDKRLDVIRGYREFSVDISDNIDDMVAGKSARMYNGVPYASRSFFEKCFGMDTKWDYEARTVTITTEMKREHAEKNQTVWTDEILSKDFSSYEMKVSEDSGVNADTCIEINGAVKGADNVILSHKIFNLKKGIYYLTLNVKSENAYNGNIDIKVSGELKGRIKTLTKGAWTEKKILIVVREDVQDLVLQLDGDIGSKNTVYIDDITVKSI